MEPVAHAYLRAKIRCDDHGCTPHTHKWRLSTGCDEKQRKSTSTGGLSEERADPSRPRYECMRACMHACACACGIHSYMYPVHTYTFVYVSCTCTMHTAHIHIYKHIHIRTYGYTYINACTVRPYCMYTMSVYPYVCICMCLCLIVHVRPYCSSACAPLYYY